MKKLVTYCLISLTAAMLSCSDDEKETASVKLVVNGKSVGIKEVTVTRYTYWRSWLDFEIEYLKIHARISENEVLVITISEVGRYDENGIRHDGGLRPRPYIFYGQTPLDESDCMQSGERTYCDDFYLLLSGYLGVDAGQLEITSLDSDGKKVTGSFSASGNKLENNGSETDETFSISGEFNSHYQNPINGEYQNP